MGVITSFVILFIILFFIVFACVLFTNAIEHLGEELNLSEGAVGSVLAAVGTALPETIVPLVAILGAYFTGSSLVEGQKIGIGAILGAPFMLGTLAFFVTGVAVMIFTKTGRRSLEMPVNPIIIFRDFHYFIIGYTIAILSSFIPIMPVKHLMAIILIILYGIYVYRTVRTKSDEENEAADLDELYIRKYLRVPQRFNLLAVIIQVVISLIAIILLAQVFVEQLKFLSEALGINSLILSLIITPIATELPEKFNSVIWIRAKKDTLAMGNITGAMVFQSCIPTAVGIALTPWILSTDAIVNIIIVYLSVSVSYLTLLKNRGVLKPSALLYGGVFYLFFLSYVLIKIFAG